MAQRVGHVQELIEYIIDFLHDDPQTLANCTLISSAWARRAERNLFASVDILLRNTDEGDPPKFKELLAHVRTRPKLASFIKTLPLRGFTRKSAFRRSELLWEDGRRYLCTNATTLFPHLCRFELCDFLACDSLTQATEFLLTTFPRLEALVYRRPHIPKQPSDVQPVISVLCRTVSLRHLGLEEISGNPVAAQMECCRLMHALNDARQLFSLVSLALLIGPGVSLPWLSPLLTIGAKLREFMISVNDVTAPGSQPSYHRMQESQLRECLPTNLQSESNRFCKSDGNHGLSTGES